MSTQLRLASTWLALSGITLLAWLIATLHGSGALKPDAAVALGAIAITVVKVRVIVMEFMDAKHAPARLRHIVDGWLVMFVAAMLTAYFV
jgi:hypothetical protein